MVSRIASSAAALSDLLRSRGPILAGTTAVELGVSKPTLNRLVRDAGPRVLRIGKARATRYALAREVRNFGSSWPVYRIGPEGRAAHFSTLHALHEKEWWCDFEGQTMPSWLKGADFSLGLFPGLPWFLDDLRPQGFMGRAFARRHANELDLRPDPRDWSADDVLAALLLHGDDGPGDFLVGDAALERFQRSSLQPPEAVQRTERSRRYPAFAQEAIDGTNPGSSAGGEQPKFTTCVVTDGSPRHVLVKFSPAVSSGAGRRWADLLVCEHLASETLRSAGVNACETECLVAGDRYFLEVTRYDRAGWNGRRGFVSLLPFDNAYFGGAGTWLNVADRLAKGGWLTKKDAETLRFLWWFGGFIGNTDRHFGNVGLSLEHVPLRLAPAYDMLPMNYRPSPDSNEAPLRPFDLPLPMPQYLGSWRHASEVAILYWKAVSKDRRITTEFRGEAERLQAATRKVRKKFG